MAFVTVGAAVVATPVGAPQLVYVTRSDEFQIALLDTLLPAYVPLMIYRTKPFDARDTTKRAKRLRVWGEGAVTGGMVIFTADDQYSETYAVVATSATVLSDILIEQECTPMLVGAAIDVTLVLSGTGLVIRDTRLEFTVVT